MSGFHAVVVPSGFRTSVQPHRWMPGTGFYADGSGGQYARLCYSLPDPERIGEGIRRLVSVIETEIQLRDDFGPA